MFDPATREPILGSSEGQAQPAFATFDAASRSLSAISVFRSDRPHAHLSRVQHPSWRGLAVQDWIVTIYLLTLLVFTLLGDGPRRRTALAWLAADILVFAGALILARGKVLKRAKTAALVYRLGLFAAIFGTFSHLQYILPTARAMRLDAQLHAFDLAVFGFEPAQSLDRFVTTGTTEWFSFFYFGYFFILAVHLFPFMFAVRNTKLLGELALGIVALFCAGHLLYVVVPGYGPYQYLAGRFAHDLDGPIWWRLVRAAVDAGEVTARTDIFPSLHTAAPTYLALFSLRHRRHHVFKWTWIPMGLFASQIVISTMFLRWHYLIDVIAGLALAGIVSIVAVRVSTWEAKQRLDAGIDPVWTPLWSSPADSSWRRDSLPVASFSEREEVGKRQSGGWRVDAPCA